MRPDSKPPILHIQNHKRMEGEEFYDGRFVCTTTVENDTLYRFQFCDHNWPSTRYIWIEILRIADWDRLDKKWVHRLNYPNCPQHIVTSKYLSDFRNAVKTMGMCLKESINR